MVRCDVLELCYMLLRDLVFLLLAQGSQRIDHDIFLLIKQLLQLSKHLLPPPLKFPKKLLHLLYSLHHLHNLPLQLISSPITLKKLFHFSHRLLFLQLHPILHHYYQTLPYYISSFTPSKFQPFGSDELYHPFFLLL